jgi:hypothetical protein
MHNPIRYFQRVKQIKPTQYLARIRLTVKSLNLPEDWHNQELERKPPD